MLKDKNLQIMLSLLIYDNPKQILCKIQTSDSKTSDKKVTLCPNNCNVTTKDQSQ